jgi:hypothetical protein
VAALRNGGFHVDVKYLPERFTRKNRVIIGHARAGAKASIGAGTGMGTLLFDGSHAGCATGDGAVARKGADAVSSAGGGRSVGLNSTRVPLADDPVSRSAVARVAGRAAASARRALPLPFLDVSFWQPKEGSVSTDQLQACAMRAAVAICGDRDIAVAVVLLDDYRCVKSGRAARTFRVTYSMDLVDNSVDVAKRIHHGLCGRLEEDFPGSSSKQSPPIDRRRGCTIVCASTREGRECREFSYCPTRGE